MIRYRTALLAWGLVFGAGHAWAQSPPPTNERAVAREPTRLQAGVGIVGFAPTGQFRTFVPDGAGGLFGHLDVGLGHSVFSLGGEIGWMLYGDETRTVSLAQVIPELGDKEIVVNTSNAILTLHARVRVQPRRGRWRPYADGLLGSMDIYTKSNIGEQICRWNPISNASTDCSWTYGQHTNSRDFVWSYGAGGGVMIGFSSSERAPRLDVAVRYLKGGEADYLTQGVRNSRRSQVDAVGVYIGVAFGR